MNPSLDGGKAPFKVLLLGLDASGKSSVFNMLRTNEVLPTVPTQDPVSDIVEYKETKVELWDLGGQEKPRKGWIDHFENTSGIIFMIDCLDYDRINEAKEELDKVLSNKYLKQVPLLIFGNKHDIDFFPSFIQIDSLIEILKIREIKDRHVQIMRSTAIKNENVSEGYEWLLSMILKKGDPDSYGYKEYILKKKPCFKLVVVGIEGSGKTSIISRQLKDDFSHKTEPTATLMMNQLQFEQADFTVYDFGGSYFQNADWQYEAANTQAVIFVVDASDKERVIMARNSLSYLLGFTALQGCPLMVFANKIDKEECMSKEEIIQELNLLKGTDRQWKVQETSALNGYGIAEGISWIEGQLLQQ